MLSLQFIRDNLDLVRETARNKRCTVAFEYLVKLDTDRREFIQKVEQLKAQQNEANERIAAKKQSNKKCDQDIAKLRMLSQKIKNLDASLADIIKRLNAILITVPNVPHESVPIGGEEANRVVREWGTSRKFDFEPKDHLTLGESLGYLSMARAARMTGSGFALLHGEGARLERALINFMVDFHIKNNGYTEVAPPFLVNRQAMLGTGQLPKLEEDMYLLKDDDFFLIPTAEVPVTNMHRDEIIPEENLPLKYVAYTPCFRREAGSYGKDTRGLSRVHQFDKVELVKFVKPERSYEELDDLVKHAEAILQALEIPHRVKLLATSDLSFAASKCYDIDAWAPGSKKWFEVSSCSNFCDFQARRANIRFKGKTSPKPRFVHTLNGSGVALARLVISILENYQRKDGTVEFPKVLQPYFAH